MPELTPTDLSAVVTTSSVLRWLTVIEAQLTKSAGRSDQFAQLDRVTTPLASRPALAQAVLLAAADDPNIQIREWAICSQWAPAGTFARLLTAEQPDMLTDAYQRLAGDRLTPADMSGMAWMLSVRWVYGDEFPAFLQSPAGQTLATMAMEQLRSGQYRAVNPGFQSFVVRAIGQGHRLDEWLAAAATSGYKLEDLGFEAPGIGSADIDPLVAARALCGLETPWDHIVTHFGEYHFGTPVVWPRDVLKVFLAHHPHKEARLAVLKLLEPGVDPIDATSEQAPLAPPARTIGIRVR